jgi:hypothetical protein
MPDRNASSSYSTASSLWRVASVLPPRFSMMSIWGKIVSVVSAKAVRASIERAVIGAPQALCWCG